MSEAGRPYRDSTGRSLADYPRPSVAVDTAVLTVPPSGPLCVLLVRRAGGHRGGEWALPGTFLHEGETLAGAVGRSLREKAGIAGIEPRQLHVFDDPGRDDRGWVLSVAHVAEVAWRLLRGTGQSRAVPVADAAGLPFDHDAIVRLAVDRLRADYRGRPDPAGLLDSPFTLLELRRLHEAVAGGPAPKDAFRRAMAPWLEETGEFQRGTVGKPARLYRKAQPAGAGGRSTGIATLLPHSVHDPS